MEDYLASIKLFAGTFCPSDFMYCDGQSLQVSQNPALFSLLGNQYGGDGVHTFNLPNLNKTPIIEGTRLKYVICVQGMYPSRD